MLQMKLSAFETVFIFGFTECPYNMLIPFVVLQELDQLKRRNGNSDSVSSKASRAIRYIYDELKSKNPRLQGNKT